jgi:hypothetical protein
VVTWAGPQVAREALVGDTLWLSDAFDGTVSPLSAERMTFEREALHPARMTMGEIGVGGDVWVKTTRTLGDTGPEYLERFDGATGARRGRPVPVGRNGQALTFARGSIWIATATELLRLAPATGTGATSGASAGTSGARVRALVAGPLPAGKWHTSNFAVPFAFTTPALDWLAVYPLPDSIALAGARQLEVAVGFWAPRQIFVSDDAKQAAVTTPQQVLEVLQHNARLRVIVRPAVEVGGEQALRVEIVARNPRPHPEVCGPDPCVLLFPTQNSTQAVTAGKWHQLLILQHGARTVVVTEDGAGDHRRAELQATRLLSTLRFE